MKFARKSRNLMAPTMAHPSAWCGSYAMPTRMGTKRARQRRIVSDVDAAASWDVQQAQIDQ